MRKYRRRRFRADKAVPSNHISQVQATVIKHGVDPQHDPDVGTLPLGVINFKFRCLINVVECIGGDEDEPEEMRHLW